MERSKRVTDTASLEFFRLIPNKPTIPGSTIPNPPGVNGTVVRIAFARVTKRIREKLTVAVRSNAWMTKYSRPTSVNHVRKLMKSRRGNCPKLPKAP
jgi:hypothetical protein